MRFRTDQIEAVEKPTPAQLRAFRRRFGISQRSLAQTLGVARETLCRWESGAAPIDNELVGRVLFWIEDGFLPPEWRAIGVRDRRRGPSLGSALED